MKYVKVKIEGKSKILKRIQEDYFWMEFDYNDNCLFTTYSFGKVSEFIDLLEQEEDIECLNVQLSFM